MNYDREEALTKQLSDMTSKELDSVLINLQANINVAKIQKQVLHINTSRHHIVPWISPAGRAYSKWAADMLSTYPEKISTNDRLFLTNIVMKAVILNEDNVHTLRWLGDKFKTKPTTGNKQVDKAIWCYVHGKTTWKEMMVGKVVENLKEWKVK